MTDEDEIEKADMPTFSEELLGLASFCETCARHGKMLPDDIQMVAGKFRDTAFVVSQLQKLNDDLWTENAALRKRLVIDDAMVERAYAAWCMIFNEDDKADMRAALTAAIGEETTPQQEEKL